MVKTYNAPEIHCKSCAGLIREALDDVPGVKSVDVDVVAKTVTVGYEAADSAEAEVLRRLEVEGYHATAM